MTRQTETWVTVNDPARAKFLASLFGSNRVRVQQPNPVMVEDIPCFMVSLDHYTNRMDVILDGLAKHREVPVDAVREDLEFKGLPIMASNYSMETNAPMTRYCALLDGDVEIFRCMFCNHGHMTECHWPMTCDEGCGHYGLEGDDDDGG